MDEVKDAQERSTTEPSTVHESPPSQPAPPPNDDGMAPAGHDVQALVEEIRRLRQQVEDQAYQLQQQMRLIRGSGEYEDAWALPPPPLPLISNTSLFPVGYTHMGNDKDLYRLAKMVKCVTFEPEDKREYEDALDEWEAKSRGCGMHSGVVKNLLVHVGALKVRQAAAEIPISVLQWMEVKNRVASILFPFSRYRRELEREIEEENRTLTVNDTIVLLAKYRKRHSDLCVRWHHTNTLSDDRMKDALLAKLPADKVAPFLSVKDFHTFSYEDFAYHCKMVTSALKAGVKAIKKPISRSSPAVHAIQVTAVGDKMTGMTPKKPAPPDYVCFNYGEKGHFAKNCPQPKAKCESCGRLGHKAASCTKLRHDGPLGRTRTGFLRMTRGGIHPDLIDEATKRALFESMRKHFESQEQSYEKAKLKAQAKRDEKRAEELLEGVEEIPIETVDLLTPEPQEKVRKRQDIAHATFVDLDKRVESHFFDMEIFGRKYPSLLDSGAVISLLPEEIWKELPPENKEMVATCDPGSQPLMGSGGSFEVTTIIDLPVIVGRKALMQRFFVSPAPQTPILGMDALTNLEIQIDFVTQEVSFPNEKREVELTEPLGVSKLCTALKASAEAEEPILHLGERAQKEEEMRVIELFRAYPEVWKHPVCGTCTSTRHHIDTGVATPIRTRVRRLPPEKVKEVRTQIQTLLEKRAIQRSNSPWASAVVLVPKANGTTRLCVDYRALNEVTRKDAFPLPRITELLDRLSGAFIFSTLDLAAGFHQIPLNEESKPKTAFITPEGLYKFVVLPFEQQQQYFLRCFVAKFSVWFILTNCFSHDKKSNTSSHINANSVHNSHHVKYIN